MKFRYNLMWTIDKYKPGKIVKSIHENDRVKIPWGKNKEGTDSDGYNLGLYEYDHTYAHSHRKYAIHHNLGKKIWH